MMKIQKTIRNRKGLHARPAALIATRARRFKSMIHIEHGLRIVNAKSVMEVMLLGAPFGATMTLSAEGEDELLALKNLCVLFDESFGEERA